MAWPTVCPIADPTATPPAVAAICPNNPGPCEGAGATGAACTGAGGAGAGALAGKVVLNKIRYFKIAETVVY